MGLGRGRWHAFGGYRAVWHAGCAAPDALGGEWARRVKRTARLGSPAVQRHCATVLMHPAAAAAAAAIGVGKMTWLIDFEGYSLRNAPAVRTSLGVLHTLQNHYPERLGGAVCYHAPSLFSMTWKVSGCAGVEPIGSCQHQTSALCCAFSFAG